jgi:hypothetical protein
LFSSESRERAFGKPGEPGDVTAIDHLARRMTDVFSEMLRWSDEVRGVRVDAGMRPVFWALSNFIRRPLADYETFVSGLDENLRRPIEERRSGGSTERLVINLALTLAIDPADQAEFDRALASAAQTSV